MIAHLTGRILSKSTQAVVIETCGVGYEVNVPLSTFYDLPEPEEQVRLHVYTHVREDALQLFGFRSRTEKELFLMLISVSGIGPKLALNILSGIGPAELLEATARGDAARLQSIPGVGKKTADRIALELREKAAAALGDKVPEIVPGPGLHEQDVLDDALSALVNLGYPPRSAKKALERAGRDLPEVRLEALIKEALKVLA